MAESNQSNPQGAPVNGGDAPHMPTKQKKPSVVARVWKWLDLDIITCLLMAKGGIPPAIGLAIYQAKPVSDFYGNLGYLIAIASFLGFAILPRAKFIQNMMAHLIGICVTSSISMLGLWSAVQARKHTTPPHQPPTGYNSSACAVCGIWLFFLLYVINAIRSAKPQLMLPTIMTSVFATVAFTTGASLPTVSAAKAFIKQLLSTFLTGFAISTAVSLLIIPVNARLPVFKQMAGFLSLSRKLLKAVSGYLRSLDKGLGKSSCPQVGAMRATTIALKMLHGKITGDIDAAKREVAYGQLDGADITEIFSRSRKLIPAFMGLASIANVLDNMPHAHDFDSHETADISGASVHSDSDSPDVTKTMSKEPHVVEGCNSMAGLIASSAITAIDLMDEAIEHVLLTMRWSKPPKDAKKAGGDGNAPSDIEAKGDAVRPGDIGFTAYYTQKSKDLYMERRAELQRHFQPDEVHPVESSRKPLVTYEPFPTERKWVDSKKQYQLVFILYLEWFIDAAHEALLELVKFADSKRDDGTFKKSKLIFPGKKHLRKWLIKFFTTEGHPDNEMTFGEIQPDLSLLESQAQRLNPERLPPTNAWQRLGDNIAAFPRLIRSPHSSFGFRAACATLTIAIVSYLRDSHVFATKERLLWAEIMIAISMVRTAGMSLYQLMLRICGTVAATIGSYVVWYIVDGKVPGVIVFTYIWIALSFYLLFNKPQFIIAGILTAVTTLLIIGYELQVEQIGIAAVEASGQPYYPIYILAPYRLAIVIIGLLVAFFWTIFPYPVSEHSEIRQDLSAALYLLSNHYAITREIVHVGLLAAEEAIISTTTTRDNNNNNNNPTSLPTKQTKTTKQSLHHHLEKARFRFWTQESQLLTRTRTNLSMHPWQFSLGSKFPLHAYETLTSLTERILNYSALLAHAARSLDLHDDNDAELRALVESVPITSHRFASRVCLLSNCLGNGNPLPSGLEPLSEGEGTCVKVGVSEGWVGAGREGARIGGGHGYAAVVVLQVASASILRDVDEVTEIVKSLVGELRFAYKVE